MSEGRSTALWLSRSRNQSSRHSSTWLGESNPHWTGPAKLLLALTCCFDVLRYGLEKSACTCVREREEGEEKRVIPFPNQSGTNNDGQRGRGKIYPLPRPFLSLDAILSMRPTSYTRKFV